MPALPVSMPHLATGVAVAVVERQSTFLGTEGEVEVEEAEEAEAVPRAGQDAVSKAMLKAILAEELEEAKKAQGPRASWAACHNSEREQIYRDKRTI